MTIKTPLKRLFTLVTLASFASPMVAGAAQSLVDAAASERAVAAEAADAMRLNPVARLGRDLFFDPNLSAPAGQSCATCHDPGKAFADPDASFPTSKGVIPGLFGSRNTPALAYGTFAPHFHYSEEDELFEGGQFLDGRAATLEDQAGMPILNPVEMHNPDRATVIEKVRNAPYARAFLDAFGPDAFDDIDRAYGYLTRAVATYERTAPAFGRFTSKYDAVVAGKAHFTAMERRGLDVFNNPDKGNCAACHLTDADDTHPALLTDFTYDNLGVPKNPANPFYKLAAEFNPEGMAFVDHGLAGTTGLAGDDGKFKVPSLRNIALTAPYMHNGYFQSLRGVVDFYNTRDVRPACADPMTSEADARKQGCWPAAEVEATVNHDELGDLKLSKRDVDDLLAFLDTLTDGWSNH